ncbi:PadR family transcriptional regulator [Dactylosporangium darangshiense]|uniref:Transcription regulator PadR N-terminal domain-containing protein n=1 Tax=Dactylosporangium darangshiense TaxID=579108 RepID=A0ABP8DQB2_9ACTN
MEPLARLGRATLDALTVLLDSDEPRWGLELIKLTGRPSGSVYPLLDRLERAGWVTSHWDDDVLRPGPRRRMYQLTPDGAVAARDALRQAARETGRARGGWAAQPGAGTVG